MACAKPLRAFRSGDGPRRRMPRPRQPEPQPDQVADRAEDRNEAGARPYPGDPRVMIHGDLLDAKPAAPALEVELRVEQGGPCEQRCRCVEQFTAHQLEPAIDVFLPNPV